TYTDCTITVTDGASNASNTLAINNFTVDTTTPSTSSSGSAGGCESCRDINVNTNDSTEETPSQQNDNGEEQTGNEASPESSSSSYFTDTQQHWSDQFANMLAETCGITGYKNEQGELLHIFKPQQAITRAEFWTMVIRCQFGEQQNEEQTTSSVQTPNFWADPYVDKAREMGLLKNQNEDLDGEISRAEALAIIIGLRVSLEDIQKTPETKKCSDISQEAWYAPYFNYALKENIISGQEDENGTLIEKCVPENSILRSETAKILVKTQE
ncbi:MAG TPA: S-layer homology domain-containing protein, partial [Candidatus Gracilibacteria bacterium]|nr:S-layer homology domain-containing protein [Candidatus Gracilibacteria bacterium]